jgi:hypothetical protein
MADDVKEDGDDPDVPQRAIAAGAGALVGGLITGPVGAVVGAMLGPVFEPLVSGVWESLREGARRRQGEVIAASIEAGVPEDELEGRINASDQTQLLTGLALGAATRTAWEDKVHTLGRSLASGLLAEDAARVDTEQMIIAAISDLEAPHLSLLDLLVSRRPGSDVSRPDTNGPLVIPAYSHGLMPGGGWHVRDRAWTLRQIASARPPLVGVAPSLLGTLQRHGLAVENDNTGEALERYQQRLEDAIGRQYQQDGRGGAFRPTGVPQVMDPRGLAPERTWSPTELGETVYLRFRDTGMTLPDAWTSRAAADQD